MKNTFIKFGSALAIGTLVSCGTVSELDVKNVRGSKKYAKVLVRDFAYKGSAEEVTGPASSTIFQNYISDAVKKEGMFGSVARSGKPGADTLVIDGDVTRYAAGNAALRAMVGLGAGSAYFDADVNFRDGATNQIIGSIKVDNNSWVLGGGLAAGQTPETFMRGAAKKVAKESSIFSSKTSQ